MDIDNCQSWLQDHLVSGALPRSNLSLGDKDRELSSWRVQTSHSSSDQSVCSPVSSCNPVTAPFTPRGLGCFTGSDLDPGTS